MDFNWMPYFYGSWMFPLLCLLFMVVMMIGCRGMRFRCSHARSKQETPQDQDQRDQARVSNDRA